MKIFLTALSFGFDTAGMGSRQRLLTDPHSPSKYRTAIVRNMDPWYSAFQVQPGQQLYLAPADRVRIW